MAAEDAKLNTLGRVAGVWLKAASRDNNGVLLVGVVKQVRQQGGYDVIELALAGSEQSVAVYRKRRPGEAYPPDSRLLVLGPSSGRQDPVGTRETTVVVWQGLWKSSRRYASRGRTDARPGSYVVWPQPKAPLFRKSRASRAKLGARLLACRDGLTAGPTIQFLTGNGWPLRLT